MANFAVRLVHGPGWDPSREIREQDGWDAHAAYMDGLVEEGFLIIGGLDGVQGLLAADPWAQAGLLRIGSIERWALWLDGRPATPAR